MTKRILLIQVRDRGDAMAEHEAQCVRRRLGERPVKLVLRNAVTHRADPAWLDDADAVVIGGAGDFSVHHPDCAHWVAPLGDVVAAALARSLPGFAICFGHQLLGRVLGRPVRTSAEHTEVGTADYELTAAGQADPLFGPLGARFTAQTGHSDHVAGVPDGVTLLARNDLLETQAFRVTGAAFWSTQFHPDLTGPEGRVRYLACKPLTGGSDDAERLRRAERFRPEPDRGATLLGRFADLVLFEGSGQP